MASNNGQNNNRAWFNDPDRHSEESHRNEDGGLFGWTVLILILIGIAIACWIGSYYVFGHPEKPFSHELLKKLKKIESPKRFELTAAPRGEFLKSQQLVDRYGIMKPRQLARLNETLLRNYIRNYKPVDGLVPYVIGTFNILDSYELTKDNFFSTGVVAIAQSKDNPNLLIEQNFCADKRVVPMLHRTLLTGLDIDLKRENELAAVVNVERLRDGRIKLTTVSILYPSYESATGDGTFTLDPPESLNVGAGLPVIDDKIQKEADEKYAHFRRKSKMGSKEKDIAEITDAPHPNTQQRLMRVEKPISMDEPSPTPTPVALSTPTPAPQIAPPSVQPTPKSLVAATPTPTPTPKVEASPTPVLAASPSPSPKAIVAANSKSWQVYEPGRMPRGRLVNSDDVQEMAKRGVSDDKVYLQGSFTVTASGSDKAVLRAAQRGGFGSRSENVRIIVQYPSGMKAPADGSSVSRDARRPFQVMDVKESTGGQINVYVREVTKP